MASLWIAVALTLALGIGANAAIFSVVRTVLLRPLANRDEARLLYIRQSAPGLQADNTALSIPEIDDLGRLKSISALGTFSEIAFTIQGLGQPREVPAEVVDGRYFEVLGLRPILGRLLGPADEGGPEAPGAAVLTYKFWTQSCIRTRPSSGKTIRLDSIEGSRPRPSWASSSPPCPTRWRRKSSPTWSRALTTCLRPW